MARSSVNMAAQACPNCGKVHDVAVYVSGQAVTCACGIRFDVRRSDVPAAKGALRSTVGDRPAGPAAAPDGVSGSWVEVDLGRTVASGANAPHDTQVSHVPTIPGYQLLEPLGKGGMGEVWRARQLSLNRVVAVKVLPDRFARDREFVARFEKEATALAALSHPNVVQIIDRGQAQDGHWFFVMELVPGITLREMMTNRRMSVRDALRIASQLARGIDYAHEQKVIHRDLKPENILIDARGHVKIADFGLAGMQGSERNISLTATAVAMGTVNYMAPEQRRDAKNVDHRADLYALGVILYEMLTGEVPLGRFKPPSEFALGLNPAVDQWVGSLLEPDPAARPSRALSVAVALDELTPPAAGQSAPGVASAQKASTSDPHTAPAAAPHLGLKVGLGVLGVLLLVALVMKGWPESSHPPAPSAPPAWYRDSEDELFSTAVAQGNQLRIDFETPSGDGGEEFNVHSGAWEMQNGSLQATQFGDPVELDHLLPRAYVAHRYWAADDFDVAVDVELEPLPPEFPPLDPDSTARFAELAFRIKDLQVSVFAIPGTDMRLGWRYFTASGQELQGNSTRDLVDELVEDAVKVPKGPFRIRLKLEKLRNGDVNAQAWVNRVRFVRKILPGLSGQVGKVALGCRNLVCRFDNVEVTGKLKARPLSSKEPEVSR